MIKLTNISKSFEDKLVLNNYSLSIKKGSLNIISGPSGCGKTTLLNIISGIDNYYSGTVAGVPQDIAFLFQEDMLLPYYSVLDNVLFTMPDNDCNLEIANKNLKMLGLENEHSTLPHELSGGMKRRVSIARALSYPAKLMLMDEPFNGLNQELKQDVVDAILELSKKNVTIIIVTHDLTPFDSINDINLIKLK